jgi:hypothetical protein
MHEALHVLLQVGGADARNGDAVAMAELEHRVAVCVRRDRGRELLHVSVCEIFKTTPCKVGRRWHILAARSAVLLTPSSLQLRRVEATLSCFEFSLESNELR